MSALPIPFAVASNLEQPFQEAITAAGLTPPDTIIADGKIYRFSTSGKRGDDSGWYMLHTDGIAAGAFGCWRQVSLAGGATALATINHTIETHMQTS